MLEVEQKFRVDDVSGLVARLSELGWHEAPTQRHVDTYYNHPCRDFALTHEALRIRRVDGVPMITYKGTKLPGAVKARQEMEWRLDPGDADGRRTEELLVALGFSRVAAVTKVRRNFNQTSKEAPIAVVIDAVDSVGDFAEIEMIVGDSNDVESARGAILRLGNSLGLHAAEPRSYLRMLMESMPG